MTERHRLKHNHERPHSSLGYKTPAEFAAAWNGEGSAPTALRPPHSKNIHQVTVSSTSTGLH
jgi:hypothetical protein